MKVPEWMFWILVGIGLSAAFNLFGAQDALRRTICMPRPAGLILWVK